MQAIPITLDRMEIEEVGYNPTNLARAIHKQLPLSTGAADVDAIARSLDIIDIRFEPLDTFEGALLTQKERTDGVILVNNHGSPARRRFTIAHELLHFLNDTHVQTANAFQCRKSDISLTNLRPTAGMTKHLRQEAQANRFAVELIAPKFKFDPHLGGDLELGAILEISAELEMSKEATARRFIELYPEPIAVMFHRNDRLRYYQVHDDVPKFRIAKGNQMPWLPQISTNNVLSEVEATDPSDWLWKPKTVKMTAQTLYQQDGFGMTLLRFIGLEEDAPTEIEDTFERYNRWNS